MTKFKILPKVDGLRDSDGGYHKPGEVVDLPESYNGETWLQRIVEEPKPIAPPSKVEPAAESIPSPSSTPEIPLDEKMKKPPAPKKRK